MSKIIRIAASFTSEPIEVYFNAISKAISKDWEIQFEDYNQVIPALKNPQSGFYKGGSALNLILIRPQDWLKFASDEVDSAQFTQQQAHEIADGLRQYAQSSKTPLIFLWCPHSENSKLRLDPKIEQEIKLMIQNTTKQFVGIHLYEGSESQTFDMDDYELTAEEFAHMPYSDKGYGKLAYLLSRYCHRELVGAKKVIMVDCDNTLWEGVAGEVGAAGVKINSACTILQNWLVKLVEQGILVVLVSKNVEEDVWSVFDENKDMILKRSHLAAWAINWDPKSNNIIQIANQLSLGLDSIVFIDDNPVECEEVRDFTPDVTVLNTRPDWTEKQAQDFYYNIWLFDKSSVTEEDKLRTKSYQQEMDRVTLRKTMDSYKSFIDNLNINIDIKKIDSDQVSRTSQLTQRTNQFNTTTIRRTEPEILSLVKDPKHFLYGVWVNDKFGDYGYTGLIIMRKDEKAVFVDDLMLSCRVLNRGVEHQLVAMAGKIAKEGNLPKVIFPYIKTKKNEPASRFLQILSTECKQSQKVEMDNGYHYEFDSEELSKIKFDPNRMESGISEIVVNPVGSPAEATEKSVANYQYISEIALDINKFVTDVSGLSTEPQNVNQSEAIRTIWENTLEIDNSPDDQGFAALGGDSMRLVQMILRIKASLNIDIPFSEMSESLTLKSLVSLAEQSQMEGNKQKDALLGFINLNEKIELDKPEIMADFNNMTPIAAKTAPILLTGATGFLGAYLLRDLLNLANGKIYCLVRANSEAEGKKRLESTFKKYAVEYDAQKFNDRVQVILGNFDSPYLGMEPQIYEKLANEIQVVLHNGAKVNFVYPYSDLEEANVGGMREIIKFSCAYKPKLLHITSTTAVWDALDYMNLDELYEFDDLGDGKTVFGGYSQTKWVCEKMAQKAAVEFGLPVYIYRPGPIFGNTTTGETNLSDLIAVIIRASFETGKVFEGDGVIDTLPADIVSSEIVHLLLSIPLPESNYDVFHIVHSNPVHAYDLRMLIENELGFKFEKLSIDDWIKCLLANNVGSEMSPEVLGIIPFLNLLVKPGLKYCDAIINRPRFNNEYTEECLRKSGMTPFDSYDFLIRTVRNIYNHINLS